MRFADGCRCPEEKVAVSKFVKKKSCDLAARVHFPNDEKRLPWLPMLLDSYAIVDTGVSVAVRQEEKRQKRFKKDSTTDEKGGLDSQGPE